MASGRPAERLAQAPGRRAPQSEEIAERREEQGVDAPETRVKRRSSGGTMGVRGLATGLAVDDEERGRTLDDLRQVPEGEAGQDRHAAASQGRAASAGLTRGR